MTENSTFEWYKKHHVVYGPLTLSDYLTKSLKKKGYFLHQISMSREDPNLPILVERALEAMKKEPNWQDFIHSVTHVQYVIYQIKNQNW